ncbi:tyrosine--tRNA ligase, mitochondrial-like [Mya arenaria]|uniref:tyrosine--tRNA ligase, mitochondrial-like n=1 Tax=Mya arenaria TaxID=6604 RepID=UPI0022E1BB37|nr:tyrosine--tRNA ligase, mitochondrial-like [Mya arenaria]
MISKNQILTAIRHIRRDGVCFGRGQCGRNYGTTVVRDILKLKKRGLFQHMMPELSGPDLVKKLSSPQTVYCGFDPTADSLHVGNLLAIIALIHCQRAGHQPIALVGGATGQVGDPSGTKKERAMLGKEVLEGNVQGLMENLERVFTNHALYIWRDNRHLPDVKLMNNLSWYREENILTFLTNVGRHFRMSTMLRKESVESRLGTKEGLSFTEFTYQIFQAYDWLQLAKKHNCYIQLGGNDQQGNITAGIELIDKALGEKCFGLTIPLVTTSQGHKVGKSEGNAVWLDPKKTTPYELYQYFFNVSEADLERFLHWFTFLPEEDISRLLREHKLSPEKRKPQKLLAEKVLLLVHGEEGLIEAQRWTDAFFSPAPEALLHLSGEDMSRLFHSAPTTSLILEHGTTLLDLLMKIRSFDREVDADRVTREGGVYINKVRVTDPSIALTLGEHILPNNITLLRIGKKSYHVVRWITPS